MPEVLQARPDVPGERGLCSSDCGVDQLSRETRAPVLWPMRSTATPGRLVLGTRARGVHQLSRVTRTRVQGPTGSTSSPG